nr:MAG TPA: protein of unknown function (DUF3504) [Caudoviricetes sp.]
MCSHGGKTTPKNLLCLISGNLIFQFCVRTGSNSDKLKRNTY